MCVDNYYVKVLSIFQVYYKEHWDGGGIIKRHSKFALLIAIFAVICAVPLLGVGIVDANNNIIATVGIINDNLNVNANSAELVNSDTGSVKSVDKTNVAGAHANATTNKIISSKNNNNNKKNITSKKNSTKKVVSKKKSLNDLTNLSGRSGLSKLQSYMNKNFNHRTGGYSTAAGVERTKYGDCWGLADWASKKLKANKYTVRVVQGATSAASNHRWVQAKLEGKWVNFESSLITKRYASKHYTGTCARPYAVVKVL